MRVVVLSDVHCSGLDDPIQQEFVQWLDALDADGLWMLGDIFHWGWSFGTALQPAVQPVVDALARAQNRGVKLLFVGGNHDFATIRALSKSLDIEIRGAHTRQIAGRKVFLAHGDEADRSMGYRLTHWLLRGAIFRSLVTLLGPAVGSSLLRGLAGAQNVDHFRPGDSRPVEWLKSQLHSGTTLAICGHFHMASRESCAAGEVVTLGAGGGQSAVWLVDGQLV